VNNAGVLQGNLDDILKTNLYGVKLMCGAFLPLIDVSNGRIVNVSSEMGSSYVRSLKKEHQKFFTRTEVTWEQIEEYLKQNVIQVTGKWDNYGLSKACLNSYTMALANEHPNILSSAVHPGFCDTHMTAGMGANRTAEQGC